MKESSWSEETRRLGHAIDEHAVGLRLDGYLAERFPFFSRAGWQREIDNGVVLVNGQKARKSAQRLHLGDDVRRLHPLDEEPNVDINMKILWSDGELAAVYKPAGLPMHESGYYRRKTVAGILPTILGADWTPVHRIDRETSGLLLCARQPSVRAQLTDMWTLKQVKKTYLAITHGIPKKMEWTVDLPIKSDRYERTNRAEISEEGDEAITQFKVISFGLNAALIEAKPLTGRTNQIRLHASAVGHPLIGDKVYGENPNILEIYRKEGNTDRVQELAGFPRHALHAWKLELMHPITRNIIAIESPLALDLVELCRKHKIIF